MFVTYMSSLVPILQASATFCCCFMQLIQWPMYVGYRKLHNPFYSVNHEYVVEFAHHRGARITQWSYNVHRWKHPESGSLQHDKKEMWGNF